MADFQSGGPVQVADNATAIHSAPDNTSNASQKLAKREKKRRNRLPVVCKPCRDRRAKCDQVKPACGSCEKRGEQHACVYVLRPNQKTRNAGARASDSAAARAKQLDKLGQLESMLKRISAQDSSQQTAPKDHYGTNQQQSPPATTEGDGLGAIDAASTLPHWSSLIDQLRASLQGYEDVLSDTDENAGVVTSEETPLLLGNPNPPPLSTIIANYLPANKNEIDTRLSTYFNAMFMVIPVIHRQKFIEEYEAFSNSSYDETSDPVWVALLFGILSLSALITGVKGDTDDMAQHDLWVNAAAQCLKIKGYTKPRDHLIPALLIFTQSQYLRYLDPSREVAALVPVIVRLAFQSSQHREPGPGVSPFEGELRRRRWVMIRHLDRQVACQFGVPASVQSSAADIEPPRNLNDEDLFEGMTELPPSKSLAEHSAVSTFIVKNKLMAVFDEIYAFALNLRAIPNEESEITRLESLLSAEYESIPDQYKPKTMSLSIADAESVRMSRITLGFLYQKSIIILHRRRMARQVPSSYAACTEAARSIIMTFQDLIEAFQPGRIMEGSEWMLGATIVSDFLLACMTLTVSVGTYQSGSKNIEDNLNVLEVARNLCMQLSSKSGGATRVSQVINSVLLRSGRDANIQLEPQTQQMPQIPYGYQPAPSYNLNGYGPAAGSGAGSHPSQSSPFQPFPTPAPSSALSEERSTSNGPQGQQGYGGGQVPYAGTLATSWAGMPTSIFEGQPMMPGLFPSSNQQAPQQGQHQQMANAVMNYNQGPGQVGQLIQATMHMDPFERLATYAGGNSGEIDWTVFDQYIMDF